jgi:hypothetical protein
MTTATGGRSLRPMSVARLRRLMTTVPTVRHFHGERSRVRVAFWAKEIRDETASRQGDWSDPAYVAEGDAS